LQKKIINPKQQQTRQAQEDFQALKWLKILLVKGLERGVAELKHTATDRTSPGGFSGSQVTENPPSSGAWEGSCGTSIRRNQDGNY
jgi:hypothetical protein